MRTFLKNLFRKKEPITLNDDVFGRISFDGSGWSSIDGRDGLESFLLLITAGVEGPSSVQRDFFIRTLPDLPKLEITAKEYVVSRSGLDLGEASLSLYSFIILGDSDCVDGNFVLEVCDDTARLIHGVSFQSGKPKEYYCDD